VNEQALSDWGDAVPKTNKQKHGARRTCKVPESQDTHKYKEHTNKTVCYCEWFRQLIWSDVDFLDQVCLKNLTHEQTSYSTRTSIKTEICTPNTSQKTLCGVSANTTRRLNLCCIEQWRFHPTVIVSVNTYSEVACPHNILTALN
jgi:hypothetical protein